MNPIHRSATTTALYVSTPEVRAALAEARLLSQDGSFSEVIAVLTPHLAAGDRNVAFSLGYAHEKRGKGDDRAKAASFLQQAANLGHEKARMKLARRKLNRWIAKLGHTLELEPLVREAAEAFIPASVLQGTDLSRLSTDELTACLEVALTAPGRGQVDVLASTTLALILLASSSLDETKITRAMQLLDSAVDAGRIEATRVQARLYAQGIVVPVDRAKAYQLYKFGTELGCSECRHQLAECLLRGFGCVADTSAAFGLLLANSKHGHPYSPCALGRLLIEGKYVPQDMKKGLEFLKLSAFRRCSAAATEIALFLGSYPQYATIGFERQAYAVTAIQHGDHTLEDSLSSELSASELPELMKSVNLIQSTEPVIS